MSQPKSGNFFVGGQSIDLNRPVKEAYRHQEYPKMLHHPTAKDPFTLKEAARVALHNKLHPEKPEILPAVTHQFTVVNSKEEETAAIKKGYSLKPPAPEKVLEVDA